MKHLIKDLEWFRGDNCIRVAYSPSHEYKLLADDNKYKVAYFELEAKNKEPVKFATGFTTLDQAKEWAFNHHCEKLSKWLNPDPLTEYAAKFTQWAKDRKIIQNGNILAQGLKLVSEIGELADNLAKGRCTKDDIGDCMVVLNNLVHMQGYTLDECLERAWNDIKDRKGYTNEHGVFIKEGDNE